MKNKNNTDAEVTIVAVDEAAPDKEETAQGDAEVAESTPEVEAAVAEPEVKTFHAFSLVEVLEELQTLVQKGYVLDLDHNETYPQLYGTHYVISVVKEAKVSKLTGLKLKGRN